MANKDIINPDILVSIIVPAYNVELYINKCLASITEQTYKNLEIIVVDDGSTDSTGALIDEFAGQDTRIVVIHQPNSGVSIARNNGIESSKGDYLVFVDGDDFLAPDYVEYMLKLAKETDAEFCLSECCYTRKKEPQTELENIKKLNRDDATALLLSPKIIVGCWNKIFKRSLISDNNLKFSTTLFYGEGLSFITNASQVANCVGVGNRKVYYYRRNNELSATTKFNIEKIYNGEKALGLIGKNLKVSSQKIDIMLILHKSIFCLGALTRISGNKVKKMYRFDYNRWLAYVRKNYFKLFFSKDVSVYRKSLLLGGCLSPWLMARLDALRRKKISDNSVEE